MEKNQLNFVSGDVELEVMIEGITEGKKGEEIAQVLDILVRQFDKLWGTLIVKKDGDQAAFVSCENETICLDFDTIWSNSDRLFI